MAALSLAKFSFDFLKTVLEESSDENIFCSPLSIMTAFSMLLLGTNKNSAEQLLKAFSLHGLPLEKLHSEVGKLLESCETKANDYDSTVLSIANGLFGQKDFKIIQRFKDDLKSIYKTEFNEVDFKQSETAAKIINKWIENKTENKIKDMFDANAFNALSRLVLANAVYFRSNFKEAFNESSTSKKSFFTNGQKEYKVDMMSTSGDFDYTEDDHIRMLSVPFKNHNFKLLLMLPKSRFGLDKALSNLNGDKLDKLVKSLSLRIVSNFELPKFKVETKMDLKKLLQRLGVTDIFEAGLANLKGISDDDLFVDKAIHKTFLDVNEHGVEAAAATGMSIALMCAFFPMNNEPVEFIVDEPFSICVYHQQADSVVFLGRINKP